MQREGIKKRLTKCAVEKGLATDSVELTLGQKLGLKGKDALLGSFDGFASDGAYFVANAMEEIAVSHIGRG